MKGNGSYVAHFGYLNQSKVDIYIPIGERNSFSPAPIERGQPEIFASGRSPAYPQAAFSTPFSEGLLIWTLDGQVVSANIDDLTIRCLPGNGPSR